jgi:hypothetical protein
MTYQNDPHNRRPARDNTSYTGWIVGGLVALALVIGLFTMFGRDTTNTNTAANNTPATTTANRPAPAAPDTTSSGVNSTVPAAPAAR